jgi:hypothetical protein
MNDEYTLRQQYIWTRVFRLNDLKQRLVALLGGLPEIEAVMRNVISAAESVSGLTWTEAMPLYSYAEPGLPLGRIIVAMQDYWRDLRAPLGLNVGDYAALSDGLKRLQDVYGSDFVFPEKIT